MDSRTLYMYILMILALFIGSFIGWVFRRGAYKKRYEKRIDMLQFQEEERFEKFKKAETDLDALQNLYLDNKDSFRIKSERLESCVEQDSRLNRDISDIQKNNDVVLKNIPIVDDEINDSLVDLEKVKNARNSFLEQIDELNSLDAEIEELSRDIESVEMLVPPELDRKNELSRNVESVIERIEEKEREIREIEIKIDEAKEEYERKKFLVDLELQEAVIEEEKYKEILTIVEKKMEDGDTLSKRDFEGVLNEKTSSWLGGVFKKSINLFKGEK